MQLLDFQIPVCPRALARDGAIFLGLIDASRLTRYSSAVESSSPLEASLQFGRDPGGIFIDTTLKATCEILCQYCLSSYLQALHSASRFRPVPTLEAAREISDDEEPVLYEDGLVNIINMLEDDALLALPNYPKCKDCENDN
jgi:uncharacterized protein